MEEEKSRRVKNRGFKRYLSRVTVPVEVACEQSKILLSIPKTSFKAASIFSAGYRPSAKYVFKSSCIRDRKGMLRTFQGLKATFANFSKVFVDCSIDQPLMNMAMTIKPPRKGQYGATPTRPRRLT
jgi:hypothetical protein